MDVCDCGKDGLIEVALQINGGLNGYCMTGRYYCAVCAIRSGIIIKKHSLDHFIYQMMDYYSYEDVIYLAEYIGEHDVEIDRYYLLYNVNVDTVEKIDVIITKANIKKRPMSLFTFMNELMSKCAFNPSTTKYIFERLGFSQEDLRDELNTFTYILELNQLDIIQLFMSHFRIDVNFMEETGLVLTTIFNNWLCKVAPIMKYFIEEIGVGRAQFDIKTSLCNLCQLKKVEYIKYFMESLKIDTDDVRNSNAPFIIRQSNLPCLEYIINNTNLTIEDINEDGSTKFPRIFDINAERFKLIFERFYMDGYPENFVNESEYYKELAEKFMSEYPRIKSAK